jgi:hypothetical protein
LDSFREDIKDGFILEIGINPIEYDRKRGIDRLKSKSNKKNYIYDEADRIILKEVHNNLSKKKKQLHRTFLCLYDCKTLVQTRAYLSLNARKNAHKNENGLISMSTIQKYMKRAKKILREALNNDANVRSKIQSAIMDEYGK